MGTTWSVLGITLVLVLVLECVVRARRAFAERSTGAPTVYMPGDPRNEPWYASYHREFEAVRKLAWRPYVYFRRVPRTGQEISIDSLGHRVTPQPATPASPVARVRMYGGSTMWGEPLRAAHTIPAEVARRLQPLAGNGARIDVTNVGETGYVFTQEVLQLFLDLRAGERPDVVVFFDGINDVAATVQRGVAGDPQNEVRRSAEFDLGRSLDGSADNSRLQRDWTAVVALSRVMLKHSALVQWAQSRKPAAAPDYIQTDSASRALTRVYLQNVRLVEALGTQYGFSAVYVWQPTMHTTEKILGPYERNLRARIEADSFQVRVQQIHRRISPMLDSSMREVVPDRFINEIGLFKDDPRPAFVDQTGHNTEGAVPVIVDAFWPTLARVTTASLQQKTERLAKP